MTQENNYFENRNLLIKELQDLGLLDEIANKMERVLIALDYVKIINNNSESRKYNIEERFIYNKKVYIYTNHTIVVFDNPKDFPKENSRISINTLNTNDVIKLITISDNVARLMISELEEYKISQNNNNFHKWKSI